MAESPARGGKNIGRGGALAEPLCCQDEIIVLVVRVVFKKKLFKLFSLKYAKKNMAVVGTASFLGLSAAVWLIAYCLLLIAYSLLLISYCLLLTAY